jgi:hypothetical protein
MKIYQVVQKLLVGDTQTGDLINLLPFFESRLKKGPKNIAGSKYKGSVEDK